MLQLTISFPEMWDEQKEEFKYPKPVTLQLEHSLVSLAKWEAKWHKPFLSRKKRSDKETIDYIRCMTMTQNVDQNVYNYLDASHIQKVTKYIDDSMTASWFNDKQPRGSSSEQVTAEIIYYWMISFNIPFECQKWHLNRLLALIRVCEAKNRKAKKMPPREVLRQQAALNAARRKKYKTKG